MTKHFRSSRHIVASFLLVLLTVALSTVACGAPSSEPVFTDDEAQLIVVARLIDMAETPEAKEYIGILFPSLALGDFVERHDNLGGWKYVIDYWPREASEAFSNAQWFQGDFDEHFSSFNRPTWVIYDDGRIVPQGGALLVEADIDKLNSDWILHTTQGNSGFENKTWKLLYRDLEGRTIQTLDDTEITAIFDVDKGQVHGSAGCNSYSGRYEINGNKISFLELAWTEMACMNPPGVMDQEEQYLSALLSAENFEIANGRLKIYSGEQILIYAERNTGILHGIVKIGPITPVEKPGEKPSIPPEVYAARKIIAYDESGQNLIMQVDIDNEGRYVANLKAGTYTIDINHIGMDSSDDVPTQVVVRPGITTRLDIDIDTGIR